MYENVNSLFKVMVSAHQQVVALDGQDTNEDKEKHIDETKVIKVRIEKKGF